MSKIQSPCVRNCCLDTEDICLGCFRSIDEIMLWSKVYTTPDQKLHILNEAKKRQSSRQTLPRATL